VTAEERKRKIEKRRGEERKRSETEGKRKEGMKGRGDRRTPLTLYMFGYFSR